MLLNAEGSWRSMISQNFPHYRYCYIKKSRWNVNKKKIRRIIWDVTPSFIQIRALRPHGSLIFKTQRLRREDCENGKFNVDITKEEQEERNKDRWNTRIRDTDTRCRSMFSLHPGMNCISTRRDSTVFRDIPETGLWDKPGVQPA